MPRLAAALPLFAFALSAGCFDYGHAVLAPADAGSDAADGDAGSDGDADADADSDGDADGDADADSDGDGDADPCVEEDVPPPPEGTGVVIRILSMAVDQPNVTIPSGEIVTWINTDTERHTMVAGAPGSETPPDQGGFSGPEQLTGQSYARRFCDPRLLFYFCRNHAQQMNNYRIQVVLP